MSNWAELANKLKDYTGTVVCDNDRECLVTIDDHKYSVIRVDDRDNTEVYIRVWYKNNWTDISEYIGNYNWCITIFNNLLQVAARQRKNAHKAELENFIFDN